MSWDYSAQWEVTATCTQAQPLYNVFFAYANENKWRKNEINSFIFELSKVVLWNKQNQGSE